MRERLAEMNKYREEKDYDNYAILVHSLKSTSKMNGFMQLSDDARELEMAAKEKRGDYIEEHHDSTMKELENVLDTVSVIVMGEDISSDDSEEIIEFLPEEN